MDSKTGAIGYLDTAATYEETAEFCKKYDIPLSKEEHDILKPMKREQRLEYAKRHRMTPNQKKRFRKTLRK